MTRRRREVLWALGAGGIAVAGCLRGNGGDASDGDGPAGEDGSGGDESDGAESSSVLETDTIPFALRTDRPAWDADGDGGRVVVVDSDRRRSRVFDPYTASADRREEIEAFLDGLEYEHERLLLVESAGPDACHDRLAIDAIRIEDGTLRADAEVVDSADEDAACAEVVTFPSALARISFEGEPVDSATVDVTDGWGDTATISADVDDAIETDDGEQQ
jgi:hypothetical protein